MFEMRLNLASTIMDGQSESNLALGKAVLGMVGMTKARLAFGREQRSRSSKTHELVRKREIF